MKSFSFPVRHAVSTRHASTRTGSLRFSARGARRRSGIAFIYFGLALVAILGIAAYSVDMGYLYTRRAQTQRAADAAALGGAWQLSRGRAKSTADVAAVYYASQNGYNNNATSTDVTMQYPVPGKNNWYRVTVARTEPLFFGRIFRMNSARVAASAAAVFTVLAEIPIPVSQYGKDIGPKNPWNYTIFGPYGWHSNGDNISTMYNNDRTINPLYKAPNANSSSGGYNFKLRTPLNMRFVQVELFDPDSYNSGGQTNASATAVDEIRDGQPGRKHDYTDTQYSIYWDNNTPNDPTDDVLVQGYSPSYSRVPAQTTYGNDPATDMKWITPPGGVIDRNDYPTGNFRINVTSVDGSSENGFNLRAGPYRSDPKEAFDSNNGTSIAADGNLPLNFNVDGTADIGLGFIPSSAVTNGAGFLTVNKFDTDVGAKSLYYTCDAYPGVKFPGVLNTTNDAISTDNITLPADYKGGNWTAVYTAGSNDTSVWSVSYSGSNLNGTPGSIKLVQ